MVSRKTLAQLFMSRKQIMYAQIIRTVLLVLISLSFLSCKNKVTDPDGDESGLTPGSRDYVWTIDTINVPFTTFTRIWGSSPDDVWVIGPGGALDKTIYHFDGKGWSTDKISRPISPTAIFGFASDNVWIAGQGGLIWHNGGRGWEQVKAFKFQNYQSSGFEGLWGDSPDNIYAIGYVENNERYRGMIAHYDGNSWDTVKIPYVKGSLGRIRRALKDSPDYFLLCYVHAPGEADSTKLFRFDGKNFSQIYSGSLGREYLADVEVVNERIYLQQGTRIYRYRNSGMTLFHKVMTPGYANGFFGRNSKDMFFCMTDGLVHFNGEDEKYLFRFPTEDIYILGYQTFEKSIFLMAYDFNRGLNLIVRGYLK